MKVIADLQLHSKYSRAVSQQMVLSEIARWAKRKSIDLMATGDWTHPLWFREIQTHLEETGHGLLKLKETSAVAKFDDEDNPQFLLATEVSSIYSQGGKGRRIHTLIWAPTIKTAEKINSELTKHGANLLSDGRPIIGLTSIQVADLVFSVDPTCLVIPAHIWTPWFSLFGSESGFDSIEECFGPFSKYIYGVETGLSSDPAMNWRIKELDSRAILSFSDAHSGPKLGREATVFDLEELSYENIRKAITQSSVFSSELSDRGISDNQSTGHSKTDRPDTENRPASPAGRQLKTDNRISATIEFYPEEGKYHYTGHRNCSIKQTPEQTRTQGTTCPVCKRRLTVGVMHRVDELAGRSEEEVGTYREGMWIRSKLFPKRPPYTTMVPLQEILAEALGGLVGSQKVQTEYVKLTDRLNGEFMVLLKTDPKDIATVSGERVADAVSKVRAGKIVVDPGYDGEFGKVKIWDEKEEPKQSEEKDQLSLF